MSRPLLDDDDAAMRGDGSNQYHEHVEYVDGDMLLPDDSVMSSARRARCLRRTFAVLVMFALVFTGVALGVPEWLRHDESVEEGADEQLIDVTVNIGLWKLCHQRTEGGAATCLSVGDVCAEGGGFEVPFAFANGTKPENGTLIILSATGAEKRSFCHTVDALRALLIIALIPFAAVLLLMVMWRDVSGRRLLAFPAVSALFLVVAVSVAPSMRGKFELHNTATLDNGASFGVALAAIAFCAVAGVCALGISADTKRAMQAEVLRDREDNDAL